MSERLGEALLDLDTNDRRFKRGIGRAERDAQKLGRTLDATSIRAAALGRALSLGSAVLGGASLASLASDWSDLRAQVNNAVGSLSAGEAAMGRIVTMARRSYSSITQTTNAFLQNSTALTELNYNLGQQLDMAETLNNALVISATRGQRAEAVMRAWSNALALGKLQGDNLNTVIQGSSRLTKALADSMGVTTNELRRLGSEGAITGREMFGVTRQLDQLRKEADAMPATPADAMVLLGNAALQLVGALDEATGLSGFIAGEMIQLADDIELAAQRWRDGEVPVLKFARAIAEAGRELGLVSDEIEDTRSEVEMVDDAVTEATRAVVDFAAKVTAQENLRDFAPQLPGKIQEVIDKLESGETSAEDARRALIDLGTANPNFGTIIGQLAGLVGNLIAVRQTADETYEALVYKGGGGPLGDGAGRAGAGQARRARLEREQATAAYVSEQNRILGLTREQLTLEQAIAKEKKSAADAGVTLSAAEAERLGKLRLAQAEAHKEAGKRSRADETDREAEAVLRLIEHLTIERDALRETDPIQRELISLRGTLSAATDEQKAKIRELIAEQQKERDELRANEEAMRSNRDVLESFISTFMSGIEQGKSFWQALGDAAVSALDRIVDKLLNDLLDAIFEIDKAGGGGLLGGIGGFFKNLFSGFFANGGLIPNGTFGIVGERGPEPVIGTSRGAMVLPNSTLAGMGGRGENSQTTVRLVMPEGWRAEIVGEAVGKSGENAVKIVESFQKGRENQWQNGGDFV